MSWHFTNAMTFENATHRARLVSAHGENYWRAERKACCDEHVERLPGRFALLSQAQRACERDVRTAVSP